MYDYSCFQWILKKWKKFSSKNQNTLISIRFCTHINKSLTLYVTKHVFIEISSLLHWFKFIRSDGQSNGIPNPLNLYAKQKITQNWKIRDVFEETICIDNKLYSILQNVHHHFLKPKANSEQMPRLWKALSLSLKFHCE